ncbi:hypothetical protein [Plebeiibacterium marinum]|uniref:Lipoprotein n=1 Tax=Plebeiibacterium marinum TaxID=2992111 RepID=A0AAE3MFB0_9BACT|nr:hypothetical protein [Plebeiobacterium marinum]MCW3806444.1 hypothetical protein [Plebeiobacterium marinum]
MIYQFKHIIFLCIALFLSGCFKEDLNKISDKYIWEPDISAPVFKETYYASDTRLAGNIESTYADPSISYIPIAKKIDLNFTEIFEKPEYIQELWFNLSVDNYFPSEIHIYIDFYSNPNTFIKQLETDAPIIIPAAQTHNNGEVSSFQKFSQLIPINHEDEEIINNTDFISVEIRLENREISDEILSQLNNYFCNCYIGIKAKLKVPLNE